MKLVYFVLSILNSESSWDLKNIHPTKGIRVTSSGMFRLLVWKFKAITWYFLVKDSRSIHRVRTAPMIPP